MRENAELGDNKMFKKTKEILRRVYDKTQENKYVKYQHHSIYFIEYQQFVNPVRIQNIQRILRQRWS